MALKKRVYFVLVIILIVFISGWLPVLGAPQLLMRGKAPQTLEIELEGWLTAFWEAIVQQDPAALETLWSLRPPLKLKGKGQGSSGSIALNAA